MPQLRAKKSLGQNFLRSSEVIEKIITASDIFPQDIVVEIGPGEGVLTIALLNCGARVIAIEKDSRCIPLLTDRFADAIADEHLILIEGDVLDAKITKELFSILEMVPSYKVVANIPYYITGMLFRFFLEEHRQPSLLTFLVQKEVAEQIVSKTHKETILSLSIKAFGDPHYGGKVGKECFEPMPKVDSAILTVKNIGNQKLAGQDVDKFFRVIKAGFQAKRKMLLGNLATGLKREKSTIAEAFAELGIDEKVRGEDLSIDAWIQLVKKLAKK